MKQALVLIVVAACGKSSGGGGNAGEPGVYKHDNPGFKVQMPASFTATPGSNKMNVSLHNDDSSQELFVSWNKYEKVGDIDLVRNFDRHANEQGAKMVEQGELPAGQGKFITVLNDNRTYTYAVIRNGAYTVECAAHSDDAKAAFLTACKTLLPQ